MAAEYDGVDALMAALTDDPLPEEALSDADFMAEHWSAAADVALLREQLGLIGGALASRERTEAEAEAKSAAVRGPARKSVPKPVRVPVRERPYWRPLRTLALGVAAVTAAGTMVTGAGWLLSQAGNGAEDSGASTSADAGPSYSPAPDIDSGMGAKDGAGSGALTSPGQLACARLVVEGTVTAVDPGPGTGQDRITLRVTRYYKPDKGPAEVTFVMDREADPRPAVGDHTLVGIPTGAASPDTWTTDEKEIAAERARITAALPESRTLPCR
ncbi:hypothetical protein GCM10023084_41070 [Streptomyces lacrimifluminis]|uniref:Uncharacterized protein n=1 Tax=Streptomyces lacrimifluminis TaxID=1500077 RepID=A0A917L2C5_9ACTN|nr:hypothetical protein [Streptomyces lacrimifluminis]GGJ41276.1 hypothetical protein GCM10012282_42700 [Streptomyces lacrimifluminis]